MDKEKLQEKLYHFEVRQKKFQVQDLVKVLDMEEQSIKFVVQAGSLRV